MLRSPYVVERRAALLTSKSRAIDTCITLSGKHSLLFHFLSDIYHCSEHGSTLPLRHCNPALANLIRSIVMPTACSPFEYLVVFAVVFSAGALTSVGLRLYTEKVRREAISHA